MKMDDIARLAGVSKASVSRVLNDKPNVSKELREKVERVLKDYDYQPNLVAQALNTKKSKLIGVLLPAIGLDLFADIVDGISSTLQERGYELILADYKGSTSRAMKNLDIFRSKQVEGIVYFPIDASLDHVNYINSFKVPIVVLGHHPEGLLRRSVSFPDIKATTDIIEFFIKGGHKRIVHIAMPKGHAVGTLRVEAYKKIMNAQGLKSEVYYVEDITYEAGYKIAKDVKPGALFVAMDRLALGMMRYFKENDLMGSYMIAGIDNMEVSSMFSPSLTSVNFDYYHSGQLAGDMVIDIINGSSVSSIVMPHQLIERESTRRR